MDRITERAEKSGFVLHGVTVVVDEMTVLMFRKVMSRESAFAVQRHFHETRGHVMSEGQIAPASDQVSVLGQAFDCITGVIIEPLSLS